MEEKPTPSTQVPQETQPAVTPPQTSFGSGISGPQGITGSPINQFQQTFTPRPSKWRYLFIVLAVLQGLGIGLFFSTMSGIARQTGSEFIALLLFSTLVPALGWIALINLIGLPIYLVKHKVHGKGLILGIVSLLLSLVLAAYGAYNLYELRVVVPNQATELTNQLRSKMEASRQKAAAENANPEITKEEAITMLKSCQLKGFYYTDQTKPEDLGGFQIPAAETSSTGVVLVRVDGEPYRISIADRLISELVPIAHEAQKTCGGPQIWHDGNYEP